jgi:seryl-tRNA synthetase
MPANRPSKSIAMRCMSITSLRPSPSLHARLGRHLKRTSTRTSTSISPSSSSSSASSFTPTVGFSSCALGRPAFPYAHIEGRLDVIAANIEARQSSGDVSVLARLIEDRRRMNIQLDGLRKEKNDIDSAMSRVASEGGSAEDQQAKRQAIVARGKKIKPQIKTLAAEFEETLAALQEACELLPNDTHALSPVGEEPSVLREAAKTKSYAHDYLALADMHDLLDFQAAARVSASRFVYLKNDAALLELALVNMAVHKLRARGFVVVTPPDIVRQEFVHACGFKPRGGDHSQTFSVDVAGTGKGKDTTGESEGSSGASALALSATAEIQMGGYFSSQLYPEASLPIKAVAFSHAFRTELGQSGADVKGLYRLNQFSKVEMFGVSASTEGASEALFNEFVDLQREILDDLELDYQVLEMPTTDLGNMAFRKIDMETHMPFRSGGFGEVSSASNCTDYQSRRLNIRYKPESSAEDGLTTSRGNRYAHTVNGTAVAVPRLIISLLEQHQQPDGSISIPKALQAWMGGQTSIPLPLSPSDF